jgi:hypothetical protein
MMLGVMLGSFMLVVLGMFVMTMCNVRMMRCFFMITCLVMLVRFFVVICSFCIMMRCFFVMVVFHGKRVLIVKHDVNVNYLPGQTKNKTLKFL